MYAAAASRLTLAFVLAGAGACTGGSDARRDQDLDPANDEANANDDERSDGSAGKDGDSDAVQTGDSGGPRSDRGRDGGTASDTRDRGPGARTTDAGSASGNRNDSGASTPGTGTCCSDGDCLCHGPDPTELTASDGPYETDSYRISTGTVYYPTDADPPFAAIAICPGFLNTGPEMAPWGPFYASHGIVMVAVSTGAADQPGTRGQKLLAAIEELKGENSDSSSPLSGKLSGRYGTSGYSMGGGGTTMAAAEDPTLKTSVGLAAWTPVGRNVTVPTLFLCGSADSVAACSQSQGAYGQMDDSVPKMLITCSGATHFSWFAPDDAGRGASGAYALAFQKVFLEGDERWRPLLVAGGLSGAMVTATTLK